MMDSNRAVLHKIMEMHFTGKSKSTDIYKHKQEDIHKKKAYVIYI